MMRAKYESLASSVLKELAKSRGIKNVSSMKKSEVVEAMLEKDREDAAGAAPAKTEPVKPAPVKAAPKAEPAAKSEPVSADVPAAVPEKEQRVDEEYELSEEKKNLDSGELAEGILEVLSEGYGFIRSEN